MLTEVPNWLPWGMVFGTAVVVAVYGLVIRRFDERHMFHDALDGITIGSFLMAALLMPSLSEPSVRPVIESNGPFLAAVCVVHALYLTVRMFRRIHGGENP